MAILVWREAVWCGKFVGVTSCEEEIVANPTASPPADEKQQGIRVEKGVSYPAGNLEEAIERLKKVREAVGFASASRDLIIQAWGYRSMSGHAARQLALLTHFGLLERVSKGSLRISELGRAILMPKNENELKEKIAIAALEPTLFGRLVGAYDEHPLPGMLANLLVREYGVFAGSADAAATAFRQTMEFAGLLRNGILHSSLDSNAEGEAPPPNGQSQSASGVGVRREDAESAPLPAPPPPPVAPPSGPASQAYTIPLDHKGRHATLTVPLPVAPTDMDRIAAWVEYVRSSFFMAADDSVAKTPDTSAN